MILKSYCDRDVCILTKSSHVSLKIPAPPEAKLTPVTGASPSFFRLDNNDRYDGPVGNFTFSAAQIIQTKLSQNQTVSCNSNKY